MNTTTEAVNALLDGVTAGPWWTDGKYSAYECGCAIIAARTDCGPIPGNPTRGMVAFASELLSKNANECKANARFIAASRELVPALLAERDAAIARAENADDKLNLERTLAIMLLRDEKDNIGAMASERDEWKARAEKAEAERDALLAERAKDHAEINLKADFIDATINQLAEAEAERDAWKDRAEKAIAGLVYYGEGTGDFGEYARGILTRIGGAK